MAQLASPGFFGKIPSRGDFVVRRLPAEFVSVWDSWLQDALARSQAALGAGWLDVYLTSPIWRFALSPGLCSEQAFVGVLVPSVDRVGRYFPLVAAMPWGGAIDVPGMVRALEPWYSSVEDLMLETLADSPLDLEEFDQRLAELRAANSTAVEVRCDWRWPTADAPVRWQCSVHPSSLADSFGNLLPALLDTERGSCGVWWTMGSERIEPCLLVTSELPAPDAYGAMLEGRWEEYGWATARVGRGERARADTPVLTLQSAGMSDPGKSREINEDSFARDDDRGVWIVADGLGGHRAGDVASRMVTSVMGALATGDLAQRVDELARAIRVVNGCLQAIAQSGATDDLVGSTVAALLVDGDQLACVWAGDSRVYRLRDRELEQLSTDHTEGDGATPRSHVITRAVGGPGDLQLETTRSEVRGGDRYLLCTDGLYSELDSGQMIAALGLATPEDGCAALREAVWATNASDNLTAVIMHVSTVSLPA